MWITFTVWEAIMSYFTIGTLVSNYIIFAVTNTSFSITNIFSDSSISITQTSWNCNIFWPYFLKALDESLKRGLDIVPSHSGNLYVPSAHWVHLSPTTLSLHSHFPLDSPQPLPFDPSSLHKQAVKIDIIKTL